MTSGSEIEVPMAPGFTPVSQAKSILRLARAGTLATLQADGAPFASLVSLACDSDGAPIILVSQLATHTKQLQSNPRCSLLINQVGKGDPLAHPRLTVTANARCVNRESAEGERIRSRFLSRQPKAELYADFSDFSFWRLELIQAYLNGGFARAWQGPAENIMTDLTGADELVALEASAIEHMNSEHAEAIKLYATKLCGMKQGPWRMTGLDPEGLDLAFADQNARLAFEMPVLDGRSLRNVLAQLAQKARSLPDV